MTCFTYQNKERVELELRSFLLRREVDWQEFWQHFCSKGLKYKDLFYVILLAHNPRLVIQATEVYCRHEPSAYNLRYLLWEKLCPDVRDLLAKELLRQSGDARDCVQIVRSKCSPGLRCQAVVKLMHDLPGFKKILS